jgi:hypothetical protein
LSAKEYVVFAVIIVSAFFATDFIFEILFPKDTRAPQMIDQVMLEEFTERQTDINRELRDRLCKVNYNDDLELWGEDYAKAELKECVGIVD